MSTATCWTHLVLLCLCCHYGTKPAACKPTWMLPQFPCDVTPNNDSTIIFDCRGRRLKSVPKGITSNATELNLSENYIQNISIGSFSNLSNLTVLDMSWINKRSGLKSIAEDAFKNLTNLHELKLDGNRLKGIPSNLPLSLRILQLNNNKIRRLDNRSFTGIMNVTRVFISKNCYFWNPCGEPITITNNSFSGLTQLQVLALSFNNLTQVPKGLPESVDTLELNSNRIQNIFENDFLGLPNLRILKLQGNCPRCENAPYPCVPCLNISLGIHPYAFSNLRKLQTLHLGGNSLITLETSWFESLNNLKQLFLSFNLLEKAIVGEAKFLSHLPRLEKMDLSFNFGQKTYPQTIELSKDFSKLVSLRTLHLQALVFREIQPDTLRPLYGLKNLSALNLGTNFIVRSNSIIFSHLSNLKMIYLAENRLYPVSVNTPPAPSQGNNVKLGISPPLITAHPDRTYEISHSLVKPECFDSGRVLILSSNNLFFISPEQFEGYGDIACLNLSRNGFSAALNGTEFALLPNLTYLDLSFNKIDLAYDGAFSELKHLEVLDLSYNPHYFEAYGVSHNLRFLRNLPALRVLNMSHNSISTLTTKEMWSKSLSELQFQNNNLGILWKERDGSYEKLFMSLTNLTILDISLNQIAKIPKNVYKHLPHNLTILRINHNLLNDFEWSELKDFNQLQILDLSFNSLSYVPKIISNYTHSLSLLDLSHNQISHLSNGFLKGANSLTTLYLSYNKLTLINQSTFLSKPENHLTTLFLEKNPFQCTCDLLDFILWIEDTDNVKIPRLTTKVTCETPANTLGQVLIFFDINQCVNDNLAFLFCSLSSTFIIVTMFVATIAHLFYWDASYVLHYLKAKLKGYHSLSSSDSVYDVFVTYDTRDLQVSEWVMEHLRVKLEDEGEKHLPLCLEDRDWPPGVPLVDNLTQSIRYSRKTLFVLTEAYVKTGAFRLAMYLAHQRLLDENVDVIVLLMLEPVLQSSHFLRLRRRLCGESVVEWPRTAAAEPWFWQNLRNVVRVDNQVMYNKIYSNYVTSK